MNKDLEKTVEKVLLVFYGGTWKYANFLTSLKKVSKGKKEKYEFLFYFNNSKEEITEKNILEIIEEDKIITNLEKINDYSKIILSPLIGKEDKILKEIKDEKNYQGKIFLS